MKNTQKTEDDNKVKMSDWDCENLGLILSGHGSWFTAKLIRLVASCDKDTKKQMFKGFPDVVSAVHKFQTGKTYLNKV
jgi:hypothetical protein